ncbi:pentapeptide repeat-containing protein [Leptolyngbya ohadii]|uniref:pentapeptide repeat-containing protein n=1 Tax=Leptolyngbya ohadii TaxID=1962290 RepID=UPI000B59F0BA|nr:pentapeptide repeat-containing protein [Leptolyngbya ohadii]
MKRLLGRKGRWTLAGAAIAAIVLGYAFVGIENGRLKLVDRTGFREDEEISRTVERNQGGQIVKSTETTKIQSGKTLWDFLSLLGVPLALAVLGFWLQQLQQKQANEAAARERKQAEEAAKLQQKQAEETAERERKQADEAAKEEALQAYSDRISTLLIDRNIIAIAVRQNKAADDLPNNPSVEPITDEQKELINAAKDVIQARTLSILRRLEKDSTRKTNVIRFLAETEIVSELKLGLSGTNLSGTDLSRTNLSGINLRYTDLSYAKLYYANLSNANLFNANLLGAHLLGADFSGADIHAVNLKDADLLTADLSFGNLGPANLSNTNLSGAIILKTDLSEAQYLTQEQLEGEYPPYLYKIKLPPHITIDPNRDCKEISQVLKDRYPERFKTLEEAQKYIDSL